MILPSRDIHKSVLTKERGRYKSYLENYELPKEFEKQELEQKREIKDDTENKGKGEIRKELNWQTIFNLPGFVLNYNWGEIIQIICQSKLLS